MGRPSFLGQSRTGWRAMSTGERTAWRCSWVDWPGGAGAVVFSSESDVAASRRFTDLHGQIEVLLRQLGKGGAEVRKGPQ